MILMSRLTAIILAAVLLTVSGCSSLTGPTTGPGTVPAGRPMRLVASFYPLQFVAERIGGDRVSVTNLTKAGAEPHDLELSPRDVATLADAHLVVHLGGFQPAVDTAVAAEAVGRAFDAAGAADLDLRVTPGGATVSGAIEDAAADVGATDPHFWLDPARLKAVAVALAARMSAVDPSAASAFATNLAALTRDLGALDADLRAGLADCASSELVTSHSAFGYLARRYGLTQVGVTGLTPEAEPDAGQLADVAAFVRAHAVRTIYSETLVSPAVADTLARETGARTAVLDPIEGLTEESAGSDYLAVMRADLATIRRGQPCR